MSSHLFLLTALAGLFAPAMEPRSIDFEAATPGAPPPGLHLSTTLKKPGGRWEIVQTKEGHVLAQTDATDGDRRFAMAVIEDGEWSDLALSVRGKPVSGRVDQVVGLVWRWQDSNNYYIARSNVLERNLRLYRVVNGNRIKFAAEEDLLLETGAWQTLSIEQRGSTIKVFLNGEKRLEADDATFKKPGKVGVWIKDDSVTWFDDLHVEALVP